MLSPIASVGCSSIDIQHKLLISLVEKMMSSLKNGVTGDAYFNEVMEFRAALNAHFAAEEDRLRTSNYLDVDDHIQKHAAILTGLDQAIEALRHVSSVNTRFTILGEIEDAVFLHELVDDADYIGHLESDCIEYKWEPALEVGVDWVDVQHEQLFVFLRVLTYHARREDWPNCRFVFKRLLDRIKLHFDNEDAYLKTLGAAAFDHRRHHFEAILSLEVLLADSDDLALKSIDSYVFQLLRNHILDEDMRDIKAAN